MYKIISLVLFILIFTLIPFSHRIASPLVNDDSNYLSFNKSLQNDDKQPFDSNFDKNITQFMIEGHIPSLAANVIYKDDIIWSKGYGEQPNENLVFKIGSITKTITTTALLQLYEQGKFELDEDVNNFLPFSLRNPNWPDKPITFRSLLLHQSSLLRGGEYYSSHVLNDFEQKIGYTNETLPSFPSWIDKVILPSESQNSSEIWGTWAPGEKQGHLTYSNLGFDLLGYLIERISNQTIEEYFKSNIFSPLNMTKTHYTYQSYSTDELASPYEWIPDEIKEEEYPWGAWPQTDENENYLLPFFNLDELGAGALRSTTTDLAYFLIAHMNNGQYKGNRILTEESINLMHDDSQVNYGNQLLESYGFAWINNKINTLQIDGKSITQPLQGHGGRVFGFNSLMFFNQESEIGVILFVNQGFIFVYDNPLWDIFDLLYKEGFLFRNIHGSENASGYSFFISSITILLIVIFVIFRRKNSI
ncbi:MAG: serine hydrolase domain-containing protein [Candidatus Kariarchaeaceae archaeon]|jgi:CubicO group peptidase (beta-lactamase class C family)